MIFEILQVITEEINGYFEQNIVALENIANIENSNSTITNDVLLTLLNLQEEYALKNISNNYINETNVEYKNPKVNLNLYIIFSAKSSTYKDSLKSISKIIEYFQGKRIFNQANTNFKREGDMTNINNFRFLVDLYTPTFEQLNYIWGTLGGKQYPSVLYKISFIEIERDILIGSGKVIEEIKTTVNSN